MRLVVRVGVSAKWPPLFRLDLDQAAVRELGPRVVVQARSNLARYSSTGTCVARRPHDSACGSGADPAPVAGTGLSQPAKYAGLRSSLGECRHSDQHEAPVGEDPTLVGEDARWLDLLGSGLIEADLAKASRCPPQPDNPAGKRQITHRLDGSRLLGGAAPWRSRFQASPARSGGTLDRRSPPDPRRCRGHRSRRRLVP